MDLQAGRLASFLTAGNEIHRPGPAVPLFWWNRAAMGGQVLVRRQNSAACFHPQREEMLHSAVGASLGMSPLRAHLLSDKWDELKLPGCEERYGREAGCPTSWIKRQICGRCGRRGIVDPFDSVTEPKAFLLGWPQVHVLAPSA